MKEEAAWNRVSSCFARQVTVGKLLSVNHTVLICKSETVIPTPQMGRESETVCRESLCSVGDGGTVSDSYDFHCGFEGPET